MDPLPPKNRFSCIDSASGAADSFKEEDAHQFSAVTSQQSDKRNHPDDVFNRRAWMTDADPLRDR